MAALGILLPTRFRRARLLFFIRAVIVLLVDPSLAFLSGVSEGWSGANLFLFPRFAPVSRFFSSSHGVYGTACCQWKIRLWRKTWRKQQWTVVSSSLTHPLGLGWQGNPHINPIGTPRYFPSRPPSRSQRSANRNTVVDFAILSQLSSPRGGCARDLHYTLAVPCACDAVFLSHVSPNCISFVQPPVTGPFPPVLPFELQPCQCPTLVSTPVECWLRPISVGTVLRPPTVSCRSPKPVTSHHPAFISMARHPSSSGEDNLILWTG